MQRAWHGTWRVLWLFIVGFSFTPSTDRRIGIHIAQLASSGVGDYHTLLRIACDPHTVCMYTPLLYVCMSWYGSVMRGGVHDKRAQSPHIT